MGPVAVPHLIDALGRSEFDRTGVTYVLANMGPGAALAVTALTHALKDPVPDLRTLAAWALGEVGREASPAVPVLRQLAVDDPSSSARRRCGWAVWRVTGDAVLVLTELGKMIHRPQSFRPSDIVRDSDEEDAINLLREIGRPALPLLTEAVRDPARRGLVVEILTPPDSWGRDAR